MKDPAWFAPPWGRVLGQDATLMPVFPFADRALPISKATTQCWKCRVRVACCHEFDIIYRYIEQMFEHRSEKEASARPAKNNADASDRPDRRPYCHIVANDFAHRHGKRRHLFFVCFICHAGNHNLYK